jgi:preprotein translocase subunit SecA
MNFYDAKLIINELLEYKRKGHVELMSTLMAVGIDRIAIASIVIASNGNIVLNSNQVDAVTRLFNDKRLIVDMATGEGKTFVLLAVAFLRWLSTSDNVFILSSSDYLSNRDSVIGSGLWSLVGVEPRLLLSSGSSDKLSGDSNCVYYSNVRMLMTHYMLSLFFGSARDMPVYSGSLIIDEVDSQLLDEMVRPVVINLRQGSGITDADRKELGFMFGVFKSLYDDSQKGELSMFDKSCINVNMQDKSVAFTDEAISRAHSLWCDITKSDGDDYHFNHFLLCAKAFMEFRVCYKKGVDYDVYEGVGLRWLDEETQQIKNGIDASVLQHAAEFWLQQTPSIKTDKIDSLTIPAFIGAFGFVSGASGTAISDEVSYKHHYNIPVLAIDSFNETKRKESAAEWYFNKKIHQIKLLASIRSSSKIGSTVVFFKDSNSAEVFSKKLDGSVYLSATASIKEMDTIINKTGILGGVLVTTYMASRGLDFKTTDDSPVTVVLAQRGYTPRTEVQAVGRTGRYGMIGYVSRIFGGDDGIFETGKARLLAEGYMANLNLSSSEKTTLKFLAKLETLVVATWSHRAKYSLGVFDDINKLSTVKVDVRRYLANTLSEMSSMDAEALLSMVNASSSSLFLSISSNGVHEERLLGLIHSIMLSSWLSAVDSEIAYDSFDSVSSALGQDLWDSVDIKSSLFGKIKPLFQL